MKAYKEGSPTPILHNQKGVREDKAVRTAQELGGGERVLCVCQYCGG